MKATMLVNESLPLDQILHGDCLDILPSFPEKSVDLVFADPPFSLPRRRRKAVPGDSTGRANIIPAGAAGFRVFTGSWLDACRRVLKDSGTLWVMGSRLSIYKIAPVLEETGFFILNDVVWVKTNPMPGFHGGRYTQEHEVLLWACREKGADYTFHHHAVRGMKGSHITGSSWVLPLCPEGERLRVDGKRAHPYQKPEALLYRILLATSSPGDVVLDPFFGTGTTGAVAKKLHRRWIGIECEEKYIQLARERIERITPELFKEEIFELGDWQRQGPRVHFRSLVETGLLAPGQELYFQKDTSQAARIRADGRLVLEDRRQGTIHTLAQALMEGTPGNGWQLWYYRDDDGKLQQIDSLRQTYREMLKDDG